MYVDFNYYISAYCGTAFKMEPDFSAYERKAERRIDVATGRKLSFAFPTEEHDSCAVKDCICELAEFLLRVDQYQESASKSMGVIERSDGTVQGKVITSVSSGSESRGYSAGTSIATDVSEAAKNRKALDSTVYAIIKGGISGVSDKNGVNLLYAGPYPRR